MLVVLGDPRTLPKNHDPDSRAKPHRGQVRGGSQQGTCLSESGRMGAPLPLLLTGQSLFDGGIKRE